MNRNFDPDYLDANYPPTFFFYDLETSGINPREDRIMQFAGQRTDLEFNPIGDPVNLFVRLDEDTLPSPYAIVTTNITPNDTRMDGLSEPELCKILQEEIFTPNTIICGFNSVRFDDEFIRYLFWRNFYDPYTWQYLDGRSKFDILDVVRMVRALRPEGINWPVAEDSKTGEKKPTNRLELLTALNGITHEHAHDALSDIYATIAVAKIIHEKQPKLLDFLLKLRDKKQLLRFLDATNLSVDSATPFVYTSGHYSSKTNHTTVAIPIAPGKNQNIIVFDLRYNVEDILQAEKEFKPEEKVSRAGKKYQTWFDFSKYVKELTPSKCPAVAPLSVLDVESTESSLNGIEEFPAGTTGWQKIKLEKSQIEQNLKTLQDHPEFIERMRELFTRERNFDKLEEAEARLYDGSLNNEDRKQASVVPNLRANELADFHPIFQDERLDSLLLNYKGRNFPNALSQDETAKFEKYRAARIARQTPSFIQAMNDLLKHYQTTGETADGRKILDSTLEDLKMWFELVS